MARPLSYEPTLRALISDVFPPASRVLSGVGSIRRRVAWPQLARATGLGEIEGGEIVLLPTARVRDYLPRLHELSELGVVAIVVAVDATASLPVAFTEHHLPVIAVPSATELRRLQGDIERYITRRRRELFALEQELHVAFVDAALAGANVLQLLKVAAERTGKPAVVDRDGDIEFAPGQTVPLETEVLVQARIAMHAASGENIEIPGPPSSLAASISAGRERRGIALLVGSGDPLSDEDEATLTSLASACAIALARTPDASLPTVEEVLASMYSPTSSIATDTRMWTAIAIEDDGSTLPQLARALRSELNARNTQCQVAQEGNVVLVLVEGDDSFPWNNVLRSLSIRLGSVTVRCGSGRPHVGPRGAQQSAGEAIQAFRHARSGMSVSYSEIELTVLLCSDSRWLEFARSRLTGLLGTGKDEHELLATLSTYLRCGRNAKLAAQLLQIHRNTLLYRLRHIERRLAIELENPELLFELDLATRVASLRDIRITSDVGNG